MVKMFSSLVTDHSNLLLPKQSEDGWNQSCWKLVLSNSNLQKVLTYNSSALLDCESITSIPWLQTSAQGIPPWLSGGERCAPKYEVTSSTPNVGTWKELALKAKEGASSQEGRKASNSPWILTFWLQLSSMSFHKAGPNTAFQGSVPKGNSSNHLYFG